MPPQELCVRRLRGEIQEWEQFTLKQPSTAHPGKWERWAGEASHWTISPLPVAGGGGEDDAEGGVHQSWLAVLRPSRGPFVGGEFGMEVRFPDRYPFQPPAIHQGIAFCGARVSWEEAADGLQVQVSPEGCRPTERHVLTVVGRSGDRLVVQWRDAPPAGHAAREEVCKGWWDGGAHPTAVGSAVFSPLVSVSPERLGMCQCGFRQGWGPPCVFAALLAFVRVALEEGGPCEAEVPVPMGQDQCLCFCNVNPEAERMYRADQFAWSRVARARFFPHWLDVAPLLLQAHPRAPDDVEVRCTNLAGTSLGGFRLNPQADVGADVLRRIHDCVPPSESRALEWRVVLPDGSVLDESRREAPLAALLGFF